MAGLVNVTPPVTGTTISSTTFGIPVSTNLGVLAAPPLAKMLNSGGQSLNGSTSTALTWDTEAFDTVNGHSTSSNTSRYTCQTGYPGYYRVFASLSWTANATGIRRVTFGVNGVIVDGSGSQIPASASALSVSSETTVLLAVGDYVEAFGFQTSGGALTLSTGGAGTALQSWFEVEWVHQ